MARSAEAAAIMLQAIAGYDPKDPTTSQVPVPDYSQSLTGEIKDLRIGVLKQMIGDEVESETRLLVHRAIDVLKDLGATVEPVSVPLIERMHGVHTAICDGQAASYHRGHLRARYMAYDYNTRVRLLVGCLIPAGLQTLAGRARALMGQTLLETFETYDVLVGATGQGPPGPIVTQSTITSREAAQTAVMARSGGTGAFSIAGAAAISIPAGFTQSGMPLVGTLELVQWMRRPSSGSATPTNAQRTITEAPANGGKGLWCINYLDPAFAFQPAALKRARGSGRTAGVSSHHRRMKKLYPPESFRSTSLERVMHFEVQRYRL